MKVVNILAILGAAISLWLTVLQAAPSKGSLSTGEWFDSPQPKIDYGYVLSTAGDIDKDGSAELLVGAPAPGLEAKSPGLVFIYDAGVKGAPALVLKGEAPRQYFGFSLAGGTDLNGDGVSEYLVGAPRFGNDSLRDIGKVYVYGLKKQKDTVAVPLWVIEGKQIDAWFGQDVAILGDIDGDSIPEYAVCALNGGKSLGGEVFIYKGGAAHPVEPILTLEGEEFGDEFGASLSGIGDINGDGINDFAIGAPNHANRKGRVYVYFGAKSLPKAASFTLDGADDRATFGHCVIGVGDFNGDKLPDYAVSSIRGGDERQGTVTIFPGSKEGKFQKPLNTLTGEHDGDLFGYTMSPAGDLNEDGNADILIGAYGSDILGDRTGRCYIYTGGKMMQVAMGQYMNGPEAKASFGYASCAVGNFDHNGKPVFAITAKDFVCPNNADGRVYIYRK